LVILKKIGTKRGKPKPRSEPQIAQMPRLGRPQLLQCGNSLRPIRVIRAIRGKKIFAKIQETRH